MIKQFTKAGILALLVLTGSQAMAASQPLSSQQLSQMRQQFVVAERALKKGQLTRYKKLQAQLTEYPLYPYLKYAELKHRLKKAPGKEITAFLEQYQKTPLANKLHYRWMKTLARQKQWDLFIKNYQVTGDDKLRCAYSQALYASGKAKRAHELTESLWLTGHSLPGNCDVPIDNWKQAGKLTPDLLWKRINLAMRAGKTQLARYLAKQLDKSEKFWIPLWFKVRRNPEFIIQAEQRFSEQNPRILRWVIADALPRLARKQPDKALSLWESYSKQYPFTPQEIMRVERSLLRYLPNKSESSASAFLNKPDFIHLKKQLLSDQLFSAIAEQDWSSALNQLDQFPIKTQHDPRWVYWRGRILEAIGRLEEARSTYLLNTDTRSYYSFLSADRAGNTYDFAHRPLSFAEQELDSLTKIPAFVRARELFILNRSADARREWQWATQQMNKAELLKAATLANQWGWHDRAIATLALARYWDDLEMRFPLAHQKQVISQSKHRNINPAWVFAVIRQESAFTADARSGAGALGLMQLMPSTAKQVARNLRIRMRGKNDLLNVNTNIKLGISYLKKVYDRFNGHKVLATAAYNAGHYRVKQWLPEESQAADLWIETVPFEETQDYMKRVLVYTAIYEQRLGVHTVPISQRMTPVSIDKKLSQHSNKNATSKGRS